jgi:NhaP-type Na+/H+ or K+/H+ antiporter
MSHSTVLLETWVSAVFAAVLLQVVAKRLRLPAIALLLPAGILLGPEVLGVVQPSALAEDIKVVIALAVAVILFEGGLALDVAGFRLAPGVIRRMLTVGVVITWLGTAAAIVGLYGYHWSFAILAASLTVVTGPTVIGPVLRRVRVRDRLHQILYWEGVLIDPIGVFIAIGCYEWLYFQGSLAPLAGFAGRLVLGVVVGLVSGRVLVWVLEHEWIDPRPPWSSSRGATWFSPSRGCWP